MDIKKGHLISISHYSGTNTFKSIVEESDNDIIKVKLLKEFAIMNFLEGDPVVFGIELNGEVHMVGCDILNINPREETILLRIDRIETGAERRKYERHPVSLYAEARSRNTRKKYIAIIKDLSCYGMLIYSKSDFDLSEGIEMDVYLGKKIITLNANIVRKITKENYFEYGLAILYEDSASLNFVQNYLKLMSQEQEAMLIELKNK